MEDQNEDNQEQSNTTIIYFFYCPFKAIEKKYKLSFFFFNEENSQSLFLKDYEKYDLKSNDKNSNIYIISLKINNDLINYEYFNIIIDDEKQKFNSEYYSLENEKDIFLLDLEFTSNKNPNEKPQINNLEFKEMYEYYNSFLNSQFKDKILQKKYDDFLDCILNSSYQKKISNYFFDILQKMISFDNEKYGFSKLGNLFLIKRGEINEKNNEKIKIIIQKLDSENIYNKLKKNVEKNPILKNKKYNIFFNYFSLLFFYYRKNEMINEFINLIKKSTSEDFLIKYAIINSLILYSKSFYKLNLKNWVENLETFRPDFNIDSKILSSLLNMVNKLEDQITIIFEESMENVELKKKKYISKYISKELKNLIEHKQENPKYAINIDNQLNLSEYKNEI
jgi:hypothetical protein